MTVAADSEAADLFSWAGGVGVRLLAPKIPRASASEGPKTPPPSVTNCRFSRVFNFSACDADAAPSALELRLTESSVRSNIKLSRRRRTYAPRPRSTGGLLSEPVTKIFFENREQAFVTVAADSEAVDLFS